MKHIIAACIMVLSVLPVCAQGGDDKLVFGGGSRNGTTQNIADKANQTETTPSTSHVESAGRPHQNESLYQENGEVFSGIEESDDSLKENTTARNQIVYNDTPQVEKQNNWHFLSLLLAIASLLLAGYNYMTLHPKKNSKKGRNSRQQESSGSDKEAQRKIITTNLELKELIMQLTNRVNELESQMERSYSNVGKQPHSKQPFEPVPQNINIIRHDESNTGGTKFYASQVMSDCFPEEGLSEANSDYAIAILTIRGDSGTFIINDMASAQSFLISNYAYGAGRVSDVSQQGDSPTRIETVHPGIIRRQADGWKITNKAQVRIV